MKKTNIKFLISIVMIVFIISVANIAFAAGETASIAISSDVNTSEIFTSKKVYVSLALKNFKNVDTSLPIAISGNLAYDTSIFENPSIEGENGWSADMNSQNGKILLDATKCKENEEIAKITLNIKQGIKNADTKIKINSISIYNSDDNINVNNLNLTVSVKFSDGNVDDDNNNTNDTTNGIKNEISNETTNNIQNETSNETTNEPKNEIANETTNDTQNEIANETQNEAKNEVTNTNEVGKENGVNKIEKVNDLSTTKDEKLPQTGSKGTIFAVAILIIGIGIFAFIRYKKFYD